MATTVSNPYTFTITENVTVNISEPSSSSGSSNVPIANDLLFKIYSSSELADKIIIPTGVTIIAYRTKWANGVVSDESTTRYIKVTPGKTYWFRGNMGGQQTYFQVFIVDYNNESNQVQLENFPGPNLGNSVPPDYMVIDYSSTINSKTPNYTIS